MVIARFFFVLFLNTFEEYITRQVMFHVKIENRIYK